MAASNPQGRNDDDFDSESIFADINVTPLVDVMLVLLVIFIVSTTVVTDETARASGIKVDLPKSSTKGGISEDPDMVVALTKDGQVIYDGHAISTDELKSAFEAAKKKNPKMVIIVQADREVIHGRVTEVLDIARELGLEHLAIATEATE